MWPCCSYNQTWCSRSFASRKGNRRCAARVKNHRTVELINGGRVKSVLCEGRRLPTYWSIGVEIFLLNLTETVKTWLLKITHIFSPSFLQESAKRYALGCVNYLPPAARGSQEAGFTQPRAHLIADPCKCVLLRTDYCVDRNQF